MDIILTRPENIMIIIYQKEKELTKIKKEIPNSEMKVS